MISLHNNILNSSTNQNKKTIKNNSLLLICALLILILTMNLALATIDIATPQNNFLTNENTIGFSAYITPQKDNCSLIIDGTIIQTLENVQSLTNFEASPDDGSYPWQISCYDSGVEELTTTRFLTVDRTAPIINVNNPLENQTYTEIPLDLQVVDYLTTTCEINLVNGSENESLLETNSTLINETLNPQTIGSGNYDLEITCKDELNNTRTKTINLDYEQPLEPLFLSLETASTTYNLGQTATLTIDAPTDSNVTLEICPDEEGFVECYTPLIDNEYPQTITLPTNKAGSYIIDGRATRAGEIITSTKQYLIENNMHVEITSNKNPKLGREVILTATPSNGIGSYSYSWTLENGSTSNEKSITKTYNKIGTIVDEVEVTDEEGNIVKENYTVEIEPLFQLKIKVKSSDELLENATVQVGDESMKTNTNGEAIIELSKGEYEVYVSKEGYNFIFETHELLESTTLEFNLLKEDKQAPKIELISPLGDKPVSTKFGVKYKVTDENIASCTLLLDNGISGWFTEQEVMPLTKSGEYSFKETIFTNEKYSYKVECKDKSENQAFSKEIILTIDPELEVEQIKEDENQENKTDYGSGLEDLDLALDYTYKLLDSLSEREIAAINYLGLRKEIDLKSRDITRLLRNINDLQYRRDLTDEEKDLEKQKLMDEAYAITSDLPLKVEVLNSKTFVKYMKEDDLLLFAEQFIKAKNMDIKPKKLVKYLLPLQQKFTSETTAMNIKITTDNGEEDYTIFVYQTKYGTILQEENEDSYSLVFEIPQEIAKNARKLLSTNEFELISEESPIMIKTTLEDELVFYVNQQVDLSKSSLINEVLYSPITQSSNGITGGVIGSISVDWKLSLMISLAIIAILFLVVKLNDRIRYIFYELGSKKQTHYLRVLADDAINNLEAGNYEKANMIYEELKLAYEQEENELVKNDVFEDVMKVCHELDEQYLMKLSSRIGTALQNDDLESAIDDYEKLEGTYERLTDKQKTTVEDLVTTIAKKLGMT